MVTQPPAGEVLDASPLSVQSGWRSLAADLYDRLFSPVDIASLVFFRIAFGLVAFYHVWLQMRIVRAEYIVPDFHFKYYGLGWVDPLPGELMNVVFLTMAASVIFIALGLYYRYAAATFFILHTYALLIDVSNYWNHYYLISLFGFLMIFVPANRAVSLDVARGAVTPSDQAPTWSLWVLRCQMAIVYFYAGLAKATSSDWWHGHPMDYFLSTYRDFPLVGRWFDESWMIYGASYVGMLFDLLIVPLVLWRRTRIPAIAVAVGFHLSNSLIFDIEVFPWLALAATALFLSPSWPRAFFKGRVSPEMNDIAPVPRFRSGPAVVAVLTIYFAFQLLIPFRYYLYPGDVKWTSEGYLFSWRMLTVARQGATVFYLSSKDADATCEVKLEAYLYPFQRGWLHDPDVMLQFANYLADVYEERGANVAVHAWTDVSVNGREPAAMVDIEADLAATDRTLGHYDWLTDIDKALRIEKPTAPPCPDPLPLERVRQIEQSAPRRID